MENKLFIYGTLSDPKVQNKVWGRVVRGTPDILDGYKMSEVEIEGEIYPLIIFDKSGKVGGSVIEVTDEELQKIDDYETDAYKRTKVTLESKESAWVYVKA